LATLAAIVNFTPDMQLYNEVQFDNISQNFALAMRYRWEYRPGDELFISIGQAAEIPQTTFRPQITQAIVRVGNTFRAEGPPSADLSKQPPRAVGAG
jgi:hypothetical protein